MRALKRNLIEWLLLACLFISTGILQAHENYVTINGVVKDKLNRKKLEYANISIPGTNIGTVTNADGYFSLKTKTLPSAPVIKISHIGYSNQQVRLEMDSLSNLTVWLEPHTNLLNEVVVYADNPRILIEKAIKKIPLNYSNQNNMLTGFYRETAQKKNHYINISEATIDIYKTPYKESAGGDKVKILRGRRLVSQKASDTLCVKLLGGPHMSVYFDLIKNRDILLNAEDLMLYDFQMEEPINIDNRPQYVIRFKPRTSLIYALYCGKLYIDKERLSFTRAEFSLSMNDKSKVVQAILRKKPLGLHFKPQEVAFLVNYKYEDGVTYLNYVRNTIRFKCDWKRKLFATNYTILSEMVVTDWMENEVAAISGKTAFGINQSFYDRAEDFDNKEFWGNYNIIAPTESLENAVDKLKKQPR